MSELDLQPNMEFQRRDWFLQRIGRLLMAGIVLFARAGGFGDGYLSSSRAGDSAGPFWIEHQRLVRHAAPATIKLWLAAPRAEMRVAFANEYLQDVKFDGFIPEHGKVYEDRMAAEQNNPNKILAAGRELQGIVQFNQIEHAVLETNGQVTVVRRIGD